MFLYENPAAENNVYFLPPFLRISQIGYLPRILPWGSYPHIHEDEYEITCSSGQGIIQLPGCTVPLPNGSITITAPNIAHFYTDSTQTDTPFSYYVVRFRPSPGSELFHHLAAFEASTAVDIDTVSQVQQILGAVLSPYRRKEIDASAQAAALSVLLLCEKSLSASGRPIPLSAPVYANDILKYLQQNIHRHITMDELASKFNLSQSHIFRVFSNTYHISPIQYLIYCRMREARTLILSRKMSTSDLARHLAYSNPYHFIHTFERFYGCRPEDYPVEMDSPPPSAAETRQC